MKMAPTATPEKALRGYHEAMGKFRYWADQYNAEWKRQRPSMTYAKQYKQRAREWKRKALMCSMFAIGEGYSNIRRVLRTTKDDEGWLKMA